MGTWGIDGGASALRIRFSPAIPGLSVHVRGLSGHFEMSLDARGEIDLAQPVRGRFDLTIDDLHLGNTLLTGIAKLWLAGDSEVAIRGEVGEVEMRPAGDYAMTTRVTLRGRTHEESARGTLIRHADGALEVRGTTRSDPRDFGVPLPAFIGLRALAEFRIRLLPEDANPPRTR